MKSETKAINNNVGGFDLLTERDSGNLIRILTGNKKNSLPFWEEMKNICEAVIDTIESGETEGVSEIEPYQPAIVSDRKKRKETKQGIFKH